jgi:hypothetical protein
MIISQQFEEISIRINQNAFVASFEKMAIKSMATVEILRINAIDVPHTSR